MNTAAWPSDWLQPQWPAPLRVRSLCTTRAGGQSAGPYANMNLGEHVGDDPEIVAANRQTLQTALGARAVFLQQVHGTDVIAVDAQTPDALAADGAYTQEAGVACTIMVADCLPILLCDSAGHQVAAVHAGWRGLAGQGGVGVVEQVYQSFMPLAKEPSWPSAIDVIAWLGPCIGPTQFEVGSEVRAAFVANDPAAAKCFQPHGPQKWLADLPALARQRLQAVGVSAVYGNDGSKDWCTVSNPSRFFSYRRAGVSGRMAACIWLE